MTDMHFPLPAGKERIVYRKAVRIEACHYEDVVTLTAGLEKELDAVTKQLETTTQGIVTYHISIEDETTGKKHLFMSGGFNLASSEGRNISLPRFQERYRLGCRGLREGKQREPWTVRVQAEVMGYSDVEYRTITAKQP